MNLRNGMFSVQFVGNGANFGSGVIAVRDGSINGGDSGYFYQGHFDYYESDIRATIQVAHHAGPPNSIFGPLRAFSLSLSGKVTDAGFQLGGGSPTIPNVGIEIRGRRIADLV